MKPYIEALTKIDRPRREYTTPKVNATMKQIMNEAYREGFSVAQICRYFNFKQARVYQYIDIRRYRNDRKSWN